MKTLSVPEFAIDLAHVAKTYRGRRGGVKALRGIEMRVHRGEVFGLLGPNGAGKSTLIKILMTVIRPTACRGTLLGGRVGDKSTLARVGYLPEHHRFPEYLTGAQTLDYFGGLSGVPRAERRRRTAHLLELVGLSGGKNWGRMRVRQYSKGMRQRLGIAQALINDPELVLLDEPTDGVDPAGRRDIRNIVAHLKDEGRTVFLNSHLLSELEMVCDRVAILVKGVVHQQGTLDELTAEQKRYEIELADPLTPAPLLREVLPGSLREEPQMLPGGDRRIGDAPPALPLAQRIGLAGELPTGERFEVHRGTIRVATTDPVRVNPLIDALRARGVLIAAVRPFRPSLEDLFMRAVTDPETGETLRPGAAEAASVRREPPPPRGRGAIVAEEIPAEEAPR